MKRHYTATDLIVLRMLTKPGWIRAGGLPSVSLGRLVTDELIELRYVDDVLYASRLAWPASLSRIVAA